MTKGKNDDVLLIRLSKLMSERGICSRREADRYIEQGLVRVDGEIVSELGSRVHPNARITLEADALREQKQLVTIILNKPVGYVSSQAEDGYTPAIELIRTENMMGEGAPVKASSLKGLAVAGRLDIDSQGLLIFTQDGRIAKKLIGENSDVEKEYLVRVRGSLTKEQLGLLNHGLSLDGKALRPAKVEWLNEDQLRFILKEGKKRQIRRMCEAVGLQVVGLKRVRVGKLPLGNLPEGKWRYLGRNEEI